MRLDAIHIYIHVVDKRFLNAVTNGDVNIARSLLNKKSIVKFFKSKNARVPILFAACRTGSVEMVELILSHPDVNVNMKDMFKNNALTSLPCLNPTDNNRIINVLLENRINVNDTNDQGYTALHFIIVNDTIGLGYSAIEHLLKNGANPNIPNKDGQTAIFDAAQRSLKLTKLLLDNGADMDHTDRAGFNLIDYVRHIEEEQLDIRREPNPRFIEILDFLTDYQEIEDIKEPEDY